MFGGGKKTIPSSLLVLKCLQARYSAKVFYTHAGCTLVALNPFQPIPDLYSLDVMKEYHCAVQPQVCENHWPLPLQHKKRERERVTKVIEV